MLPCPVALSHCAPSTLVTVSMCCLAQQQTVLYNMRRLHNAAVGTFEALDALAYLVDHHWIALLYHVGQMCLLNVVLQELRPSSKLHRLSLLTPKWMLLWWQMSWPAAAP